MNQSVWHASGSNAAQIKELAAFFGVLLTAIFVIVLGVALLSLTRRHRGIQQEPLEASHQPPESTESRLRTRVGIAVGLTVLILLGLTIMSVLTGKAVSASVAPAGNLTIEVTGTQWWWKIRYMNDDASRILDTANEIHVPVGR